MPKILVINDSSSLNKRMESVLTGEGYIVYSAERGAEGARMISENYFDLVITEILMHDMSGFEIISHIKRVSGKTRIIAMTSGGIIDVDEYLKTMKSFGADMVIKKPFRDGYMIRVVKLILNSCHSDQKIA
jgi:DNA-binding response OmpR family regulator